jgi:hypothetical protein
MKKPSAERGPKLNIPIAQPQAMMMNGVRQLETLGAVRSSPAVVDMQCPWLLLAAPESGRVGDRELMHSHANPSPPLRKMSHRIAALQIEPGSFDDLMDGTIWRSLRVSAIFVLLLLSITNARPLVAGFLKP